MIIILVQKEYRIGGKAEAIAMEPLIKSRREKI